MAPLPSCQPSRSIERPTLSREDCKKEREAMEEKEKTERERERERERWLEKERRLCFPCNEKYFSYCVSSILTISEVGVTILWAYINWQVVWKGKRGSLKLSMLDKVLIQKWGSFYGFWNDWLLKTFFLQFLGQFWIIPIMLARFAVYFYALLKS